MDKLLIKYPEEMTSPFTAAAWLCDPHILVKNLEGKCSRPDLLIYGVMRLVSDRIIEFDEFFRATAVSLAMGDTHPLMSLCRRCKTHLRGMGETEWAAAVLAERESLSNDPGYPAWVYNLDLSWCVPYGLLPVFLLHKRFGEGFFAGGGTDISEEIAWIQACKGILDRIWERDSRGGRVIQLVGTPVRFRTPVLKPSFDPQYRLKLLKSAESSGKWVKLGDFGLMWYPNQPNVWVDRELIYRLMDAAI